MFTTRGLQERYPPRRGVGDSLDSGRGRKLSIPRQLHGG